MDEENKVLLEEQKEKKKFQFPIGMRIVKTSLAAFICMGIDLMRGEIPSQSVVTTAICIRPDRDNSLKSASARTLGTIIGAISGVIVLLLFSEPFRGDYTLFYYFIVAFFMMPVIFIVAKLKFPTGVIVSLVVYLSITVNQQSAGTSWEYIFNRIIDTLIGIFVALVVNLALPGTVGTSKEEESAAEK